MRGIGGASETVEQGDVMVVGRAAKMIESCLLELIKVERWRDKIIRNGQLVRAQW